MNYGEAYDQVVYSSGNSLQGPSLLDCRVLWETVSSPERTIRRRMKVAMELAFATVKLRTICRNRRKASSVLGREAARELERFLADVQACGTVAELEDLFPEFLHTNSSESRAFHFSGGYKMVFMSGHVKRPSPDSNATDWSKVTRIKLVSLDEPHE